MEKTTEELKAELDKLNAINVKTLRRHGILSPEFKASNKAAKDKWREWCASMDSNR
jgi:hypothetical protein